MLLPRSTRLGTYEILGPLGAGGMGEVYRAKDLRLGREVAVKVLPAEVASSPDRLARFEREARTVAGLNHPNIVTLFSVEDEDGIRFLTMELVEGQSLADLVVPGGLPFPRLLDLSIQVTDALIAAHERGVVHRDLKPGNVMVTRDGRVKVLDFGLARTETAVPSHKDRDASTVTRDLPITREGSVQGTAPYMAPEQIRGEQADARTDLFALGVTLHELATGRRPFAGAFPVEVASSILRDEPEPLGRNRSDLPHEFGRILGRLLAKNPRDRFQAALDVATELKHLRRVEEDSRQESERGTERIASIAVLPFVNRSRDEEDEYFSDGLADEILNLLAKIPGLRVAASASSFQFREKKGDLATIGHALRVATLLDGSVRKAGNRVRIAVQLINASDGYHVWSETYDRTLDDIFAVQDDIAQSVVRELKTALLGGARDPDAVARAEVARAARGRGQNTEAHRLALQGRYLTGRLTSEDVLRGIERLREALGLDPANAMAWADLSRALLNAVGHGWVPPEAGLAEARVAAGRSLSIEPDLREGHIALGRIQLYFDWNWKGAEASFRRATELAPGNAVGLHGVGILAQNAGRIDEALDLYRRAVEQDPLSAAAYTRLAQTFLSAGRLADAEAAQRKSIELAPQRIVSRSNLALILLAQGRLEEALDSARQEPHRIYHLLALAAVLHALGREEDSREALRTMIETEAAHGAYQIAEVYAVRGEIDSAFEWLDRAYAQRDPGLAEILGSILLRSLHGDARWTTFLRRLGVET